MKVLRVVLGRDDSFLVFGERDDGTPVAATGWQSAVTNHFGPECYGEDGHRVAGAEPRLMTAAERQGYFLGLLAAAAGEDVAEDEATADPWAE